MSERASERACCVCVCVCVFVCFMVVVCALLIFSPLHTITALTETLLYITQFISPLPMPSTAMNCLLFSYSFQSRLEELKGKQAKEREQTENKMKRVANEVMSFYMNRT